MTRKKIIFDVESSNGRGHAMKVLKDLLASSVIKLKLSGGRSGRHCAKLIVTLPPFVVLDVEQLQQQLTPRDITLYPVMSPEAQTDVEQDDTVDDTAEHLRHAQTLADATTSPTTIPITIQVIPAATPPAPTTVAA